jgi:hypothetical protein
MLKLSECPLVNSINSVVPPFSITDKLYNTDQRAMVERAEAERAGQAQVPPSLAIDVSRHQIHQDIAQGRAVGVSTGTRQPVQAIGIQEQLFRAPLRDLPSIHVPGTNQVVTQSPGDGNRQGYTPRHQTHSALATLHKNFAKGIEDGVQIEVGFEYMQYEEHSDQGDLETIHNVCRLDMEANHC